MEKEKDYIEINSGAIKTFFSVLWTIFLNIITGLILLAVVVSANTQFEGTVYIILLIIYLSLVTHYSINETQKINMVFIFNEEFKKIRKKIGIPQTEEEKEEEETTRAKLKKINVKKFINLSFIGIFYIFLILSLIGHLVQ